MRFWNGMRLLKMRFLKVVEAVEDEVLESG